MKWIRRFILVIFVFIIALVIGVLVQDVDPTQKIPPGPVYTFADTLARRDFDLDSLLTRIGENKILPPGYEVAAAIALSAYPQLMDANIEMLLVPYGAPMEATVDIPSLFGPRSKRRYKILLNDEKDSPYNPILLHSLPFDAQVGVIAHELGHVVYYDEMNVLEFGKWGFNYLRDDAFRALHERSTDMMPVYYGLGSQIYQYAWFIRKDSTCQAFYEGAKGFLDKYYLTDTELQQAISGR
jgi:hypothetical protein